MGKFIRIFIAIVVVLSFMVWARSDPAGAANAGSTSEQSLQTQAELSASPDKDDDCGKGKDRDKDKCECREKSKGKKHCGTVKPPHHRDGFCERGDFSMDGVAVLKVKDLRDRNGKKSCFQGRVEDAAELQLPKEAGLALSDAVTLTSLGQDSSVEICFAAPPGKQVKIYLSVNGSWKALETRVTNGVACARVPGSGSFVVAGL